MNEANQKLKAVIEQFSTDNLNLFFREKSRKYKTLNESYSRYDDEDFGNGFKLGAIEFSDTENIIICTFKVNQSLTERSGKKAQYEKAKKILKSGENLRYNAGIFVFFDSNGSFRFSLVYPEAIGTKKLWNNFRRFTYYVSSVLTNKTFLKQIGEEELAGFNSVKRAFSITAVTDIFYKEFFEIYQRIVENTKRVNQIESDEKARDFVLLFTIRTIFIGFIQQKRWLGKNVSFMKDFFKEYCTRHANKDQFYSRWLELLFFEALNAPPQEKFSYGDYDFAQETVLILQKAPYLNGGLFRKKEGYDDRGWYIPDKEIESFLEFLFSHSFTIEENSLEDEELQLNPEFLGIIFERLVNKENGAVYTPRTEVDLMCRLSLVKWLHKNLSRNIRVSNLYELFFKESEAEDELKEGSFSKRDAQEILDKLDNLAICDPAVGSGAFLVGMMQVLDEVEEKLRERHNIPYDYSYESNDSLFERKKAIIQNSLYGVEVKEWAVWICHLRLWLSLFVDTPDEYKDSLEPILPSLEFKVRRGDSLVQRVGSITFPVSGHNTFITPSIKTKITKLKNDKRDFFDNNSKESVKSLNDREIAIYEEILLQERKGLESSLKRYDNEDKYIQQDIYKPFDDTSQLSIPLKDPKQEHIVRQKKEIDEQLEALKAGNKPLVWSIEFAEIFAEKEGFDIVIGNPPYVSREFIEDPNGLIRDKSIYKSYLKEMVKMDFPGYFTSEKKISSRSDLYTYFYIRSLRLLNSGGIHTFICSNSWLDASYGAWMQEFFLDKCPIDLVIDNHFKRSFGSAEINTIISIIHSPLPGVNKFVPDNNVVKFVAFRKPFEETVFTESILQIEETSTTISNDVYRIYPITNKEIKKAGIEQTDNEVVINGIYTGDKWGGEYLKAPDLFIRLLQNKYTIFNKLSQLANVIGYVHDNSTGQLYPKTMFIKSIKNANSILLKSSDRGVINYGVSKKGNSRTIAPILVPRTFGQNHLIIYNIDGGIGKEFYRVIPDKVETTSTLVLFLNSTFLILQRELFGLTNLGGGALKLSGDEIRLFLIPKNLGELSLQRFNGFVTRDVEPIFIECGIDPKSEIPIEQQEPKPLSDRAELDNIVFDALDLTQEERKDVYRAVCRLVWNRISKAKSV